MESIWKSRKFWIMAVDVLVSLVTYFTGKYTAPETSKDILFLIGALQPVILLVVGSITAQNVAGINATRAVDEAKIYNAAPKGGADAMGYSIPISPITTGDEPEYHLPWVR